MAPFYDVFTRAYDHASWLDRLEGLVRALGLEGQRLFDVGCGTGKSFQPMLDRGWDVTACDLSPAMVRQAAARHPLGDERVFVADMRALPPVGPFDLVTCLDDAVNYLLDPADLEAAFASIRATLRPGGLLVFDCNSLLAYRTAFSADFSMEQDGLSLRWCGAGDGQAVPGAIARAAIEARLAGADGDPLHVSHHVQRHHPVEEIEAALERAGLSRVAALGQLTGARFVPVLDELRQPKLVFVAGRPEGDP